LKLFPIEREKGKDATKQTTLKIYVKLFNLKTFLEIGYIFYIWDAWTRNNEAVSVHGVRLIEINEIN
jgi:hypothetical protein